MGRLTARPYGGPADAKRIAETINGRRARTEGGAAPVPAEEVEAFVETAWADFDARHDMHLFFRDGRMAAYERTKRETWAGGVRVYHLQPFVHPDFRSQESLSEILKHIVRYQSEYARRDVSGGSPFLAAMPDPSDEEMIGALLAAGFEPCHHFLQMTRSLDEEVALRDLPPNLALRPVRESQHRSIYDFDRRIMRGLWGVEAPTESHFRWWSEEAFLDPELWRVAWDGDEIVGTAAGVVGGTWNPSLGGGKGEIRFVRVAPEWRRRGVASTLILLCLAALRARGIREVVLGVDGENEDTAAALYRTLGFEVASCRTAYRRDLPGAGHDPSRRR